MRPFSVGDIVRVKCLDEHSCSSMNRYVGTKVKIFSMSSVTGGEVHVYVNLPGGDSCYFHVSSLEHVEDEKRSDDAKCAELAAAYGVAPKVTHSATIVLASGRIVDIPNPDPALWGLTETQKDCPIGPVTTSVENAGSFLFPSFGCGGSRVDHEEGRCWLKDMSRVVNETTKIDAFTTKYAYVTELRTYKSRAPKAPESYECANPVLKVLW